MQQDAHIQAEAPTPKFTRLVQEITRQLPILAGVSILELLNQLVFRNTTYFPSVAALVLLAIVVSSALRNGVRPGLLSAAVAVFYVAYYYSLPHRLFSYDPDNLRRVLLLAVVLPSLALIVGRLKERVDILLQRERAARLEAESLARQRESELARLAAVIQQMPGGVIIAEARSGKLSMANEQVNHIWRHSFIEAASIAEYNQYNGFHPDGRSYTPEEWPLARSLLRGEIVTNEEIEILRGDRTRGTISVSSSPIRDHAGQITAAVTTFSDITEQKKAEEALRYQSQLTKTIADNAASCLFMIDTQGRGTYINRAGENITGYTLEEIQGQVLHELIHHTRPDGTPYPISECPLDRALPLNVEVRDHEDVFVRKDGTFFPVVCAASPISKNGVLVGTVIEVQDITERKRLERRGDEFLSLASHELKTPITSIMGFAELLLRRAQKRQTPEPELKVLESINRQADRLTRLITDMLDVSRIATDKLTIQFEDVDLSAFLHEVVEQLQMVNGSHTFTLNDSYPCIVYANHDRLQQVMLNLLSNAIHHSPEHSTIRITLQQVRHEAIVSVQDEGVGIPKEKQAKLFQRFYQAQEQPARGMGLGLYISREIIERHGGMIWVVSEEGKGSTFSFSLPLRKNDA